MHSKWLWFDFNEFELARTRQNSRKCYVLVSDAPWHKRKQCWMCSDKHLNARKFNLRLSYSQRINPSLANQAMLKKTMIGGGRTARIHQLAFIAHSLSRLSLSLLPLSLSLFLSYSRSPILASLSLSRSLTLSLALFHPHSLFSSRAIAHKIRMRTKRFHHFYSFLPHLAFLAALKQLRND